MTPKKLNRLLLASLLLITLTIVIGLYISNQKLSKMAHETAKLHTQSNIDKEKLSVYKKTKLKVDSLSYVDHLADKVLPATAEQSTVVAEVAQFAARSGVAVESIDFELASTTTNKSTTAKGAKKTSLPSGVTVIPISIKLQNGASYQNLLAFLHSIENNQRKSQITSIDLVPDKDNRNNLNQVRIMLNVYARKAAKK